MHGRKYANAARTSDLIFAISKFTAADVAETLAVATERIAVAYPGVDERYTPDGPKAEREGPYVLAVATLEPRKNLSMLAAAHALVRAQRPELELVVAGAPVHGREQELAAEGVTALGFVADEQLPALYRGASVVAYPSLFEGFGIPVVEAMGCGTPVVASSHASLDESCGDAAVRADPTSAQALADGDRKSPGRARAPRAARPRAREALHVARLRRGPHAWISNNALRRLVRCCAWVSTSRR